MKKVAVFMGTRPEAIKMAPVIKALEKAEGLQPIVVSTGQHREMLDQVVDIFDLKVDHDLEVMQPNQTLASLTSRLMERTDALLEKIQPDFALVQGDTTTVMIASLACFYRHIPVGHVEAGLRTDNIYSPFPEEVNRRLASPMMVLHFAPTKISEGNLLRENVAAEKIHITGNTVVDALFMEVERQKNPAVAEKINTSLSEHLPGDWKEAPYVLVTGHRRENFGGGFEQICAALAQLAQRYPDHRFIYPVHLNPNVQGPVYSLLKEHNNIFLIPPQDYSAFVALMKNSQLILTDSGGVQEEAPSLGKPVLVMRDTTERPEGLDAGTVKLVGAETENIVSYAITLLDDEAAYLAMAQANNPYGDGCAAERIAKIVGNYF
ncbi:MAG TPA: UDP-N-acetylglucosamine 2-epimerase (non-hydrolyzing) [Chromatiaceae bacterium]|nr:UDP-N-acetylglucosamine 2-epimerase (non-hydrolyzing) [Chromatiaceae bacterium]